MFKIIKLRTNFLCINFLEIYSLNREQNFIELYIGDQGKSQCHRKKFKRKMIRSRKEKKAIFCNYITFK